MTYIGALSGSNNSSSNSSSSLLGSSGLGGISGLASGIDTDSIVNALMQEAQQPLVSLLQQRQILQWKEDLYHQVSQSLSDLQDALAPLKLQSTFLTKSVTSSNSSLVSATATSLAATGTYQVAVTQLAQGVTIASSSLPQTSSNYGDTSLSALGVNQTVTLQINGGTVLTFDPTATVNDVLSAITSHTDTGVNAFYDPNSNKVIMQTTATGSGAQIVVNQDSGHLFQTIFHLTPAAPVSTTIDPTNGLSKGGTVYINGHRFDFSQGDAGSTIEQAINEANIGVTATYDSASGQLTLTPSSNVYSPISVTDPNGILGITGQSGAAEDAVYNVNGVQGISSNNTPTFGGLTLHLTGVSPTGANGQPQTTSLTVTQDTDSIVQKITAFVQQYNTTLQLMQGLYNQQRNYDYLPLTSQQASQMTQDQINKWNQQAQAGLLNGDDLLASAMSGMEDAASQIVNGQPQSTLNGQTVTFKSLADIGIQPYSPINGVDTGYTAPGVYTTGWNTYGLLEIDTDKLTQALQADPESVMRLFTNSSDDPSQQGIAVQMYNSVFNSISAITQEAGLAPTTSNSSSSSSSSSSGSSSSGTTTSTLPYDLIDPNADLSTLFGADALDISFLGNQIKDIDDQATDMQQQLSDLRQRYLDQFSQMEQALAQLNDQSNALISMLGQSGGNG
jgi:flagellar hook-associated protein 2